MLVVLVLTFSILAFVISFGTLDMYIHYVDKDWAPLGYDRAVELFERNFYDNSHFFRVVPGFLTQFGMSYTTDHELQQFARTPILDDPQLVPPIGFKEGIVSFAGKFFRVFVTVLRTFVLESMGNVCYGR